MFDLQEETLDLTAEDVYFTMGLSHRGAPMNRERISQGGDPLHVQDYIDTYCVPGTQKSRTQILISQITSFPLKVIMSTIVKVEGSSALHLALRLICALQWSAYGEWCMTGVRD